MALLNFRDVAGESSRGPLKPGRLFRSAQPFNLDSADLALIAESGIRTVIDLREQHEQVPPDWAPAEAKGVQVVRVSLADQILPAAGDGADTRRGRLRSTSVPEGHRILAEFYLAIADLAGAAMADALAAVADGSPTLVHCAAGKDRTGTTVALLLDLIGTDDDTIVADYLLTNDSLSEVMLQLTGETAEQRSTRRDIPPGTGDAPESAIRALLDHVREQGGARELLRRNTDPAVLDRVIKALTS